MGSRKKIWNRCLLLGCAMLMWQSCQPRLSRVEFQEGSAVRYEQIAMDYFQDVIIDSVKERFRIFPLVKDTWGLRATGYFDGCDPAANMRRYKALNNPQMPDSRTDTLYLKRGAGYIGRSSGGKYDIQVFKAMKVDEHYLVLLEGLSPGGGSGCRFMLQIKDDKVVQWCYNFWIT